MPANQRRQAAQSPPSPTSRNTAKYTNKDGSKFITVPKVSNPSTSSETSPTMAQNMIKTNGQPPASSSAPNGTAPTVNRKKQKRREKEAAKRAAEQSANPVHNGAQPASHNQRQMQELEARFREHGLDEQYEENGQFEHAEGEQYYSDEEVDRYSGSYDQNGSPRNGYTMQRSNPSEKKSKKKKRSKADSLDHVHTNGHSHNNHLVPPLPPLSSTNLSRGPGISKEKIWNTSSQEERQRIKEFWLSLGEDERKSLVKVEKDAVLKKMKEQQKHSCSCTVCGRKRTAIEEELEVLYDAYYEELEQYANIQGDGVPPIMATSRRFGDLGGLQPPNRLPPFSSRQPSRGRIMEQSGDEEDEDESEDDYSDRDEREGDEDEYSEEDDEPAEEEEPAEIIPRNDHATDFFNFGNSLTVQGGILTVADDLLKNDGKKFIEMMEQLAERRMAREEDAREPYQNRNFIHSPNGAMHSHAPHTHNHPPPQDEEEYDDEDEDDEEYGSDEEDYDEEEMDTMTDAQRMEEGRRMFQIFAARMFEQRVLTAYKEKVANERQRKLLEELADEEQTSVQKKAKKAKDAQKKKEKAAQKKQALAEEKAKREAEKAAEESALREAEAKKLEEQRAKAEEKRRKREAEKKAAEEDKLRKEAEKQRRLAEARDRQAELERKQREAKDKDRREKEELRLREKEAKETKEREAKERRENQEKEKRAKDARLKAEKLAREKQKLEEAAAQQAAAQAANAAIKRPPVPIPASLQPHPVASPHIGHVTPVIPKATTPMKLRTSSSQQDSNSPAPQTPLTNNLSQNVSPVPSTPNQGSPGPIGPPSRNQNQAPHLFQPQATSPVHSSLKSPPGMPQPNLFGGMPPAHMGFPPGMPMMGPAFGGRMQHEPMFPHPIPHLMGGPFQPLRAPNGIPQYQPGVSIQQMPPGRGFPLQHGPPGFSQQPPPLSGITHLFNAHKEGLASQAHSRQHSGTFDKLFEGLGNSQAQPIARPAPIGRPSSIVHGQRNGDGDKLDIEDVNSHLGSSALLDDSDEPISSGDGQRRSSAAPGNPSRQSFPPPYGMDHMLFGSPVPPGFSSTWGPPNPYTPSSLPGPGYMGGWGIPPNQFGAMGNNNPLRSSQSRSVAVRLNMCRACKTFESSTSDGFVNLNTIKNHLDQIFADQPVSDKEILDLCETEGNAINGGGVFHIGPDESSIRFEQETLPPHRPFGAPGEIGSPIIGGGGLSRPPGF